MQSSIVTRAGLAAALGLFAFAAAGLRAEVITNSNVNFSGNAQNFSISLDTNGGGTASVDGSGTATVWVPLVLGTGFHQDADFDVPHQTVQADIVGGAKTFTSHPNGNMLIGTSSTNSLVSDFNNVAVDLQNGANWGIAVTPIHVTIHLETEIVFIPIRFTVDLEINLTANLINFNFDDSAPGETTPDGFFGVPGMYRGGLDAHVRGVMHNVPIVGDYDLGEVTNLNDPNLLAQDLPLFGSISQVDLEPLRDTYPHDYTVAMGTNLAGFALDFPIDVADTISENLPVDDGESGIKRVNLNYAVSLNVKLSGLSYDLSSMVRNGIGQPDNNGYRPFYRNWDAARDFGFDSPYGYAWYGGRDRAWGYGYGGGDLPYFSPYNFRDDEWSLGPTTPAWVYNEQLPEPQPGFAKVVGNGGLGYLTGDLACITPGGPPVIVQWRAPADINPVVDVMGMGWDPKPSTNNTVTLTYRIVGQDQVLKQILTQRTITSQRTLNRPDYFILHDVPVAPGDVIEVIIEDNGVADITAVQLYVQEPVAGGGARARGDFDNSGCTDVADFLFLLDNWQLEGGSYTPPVGIGDFLALLDNWQEGATCGQ